MIANVFALSVQEIYAYIQQQTPCWKGNDPEYHMLHDKAGKLAWLLLQHTKDQSDSELALLPLGSQDPESVTACKQAMELLENKFHSSLSEEQREQLLELEEYQSKIEWEQHKAAYVQGMVNGMILLANIAPLVFLYGQRRPLELVTVQS